MASHRLVNGSPSLPPSFDATPPRETLVGSVERVTYPFGELDALVPAYAKPYARNAASAAALRQRPEAAEQK
jgi:hypothetical protein